MDTSIIHPASFIKYDYYYLFYIIIVLLVYILFIMVIQTSYINKIDNNRN